MAVTPGYVFGASEKATNTKFNSLGSPQVTNDADTVTNSMIEKAGFSRDSLLFVDIEFGSDTTGVRQNEHAPFKTLGAAKTAASAGDTIIVYPGTYDEKNLSKNGVDWLFYPGAIVTYTGSSNGAIFDDSATGSNAESSFNVRGWGEFNRNGSGTSDFCINITQANSVVIFEGKYTSSVDACLTQQSGDVTVKGDLSSSGPGGGSYGLNMNGGIFFGDSIKISASTSTSPAIGINGTITMTLKNCELSPGSSALTITTGLAVTIKVLGTLSFDRDANATNITWTGGGIRMRDGNVRLPGSFGGDVLTTFVDSDTTPDVAGAMSCETNTSAVTITDFDAPAGKSLYRGQQITVISKGAITYTTGSNMECGSTNLVTASGDLTAWLYDGATWFMTGHTDQTINYNTYA